ncbi:hypothetical protein GCM10022393_34070 [Aquimarina addita]|uniref:BioF2-like acetyltransferase domain-containing protein n=1 Tax=Aquimarina addita TaxID=870485 RepID=A0ABP6UTW0_9FLAO
MMDIKWVHSDDIPEGLVKSFCHLFEATHKEAPIKNVTTKLKIIQVSPTIYFPVTINDTEWNTSFVCSPYTAYIHYAKDEIKRKIKNPLVRSPLLFIIFLISKWFKKGLLNKNVHVNNFLLSTNPYPVWDGATIKQITTFIKKEFPEHAIIFRSLNQYQHTHLLGVFKQENYTLIGSRQVYIFDLPYTDWLQRKNNKLDNKLIKKKELTFIDHTGMAVYLDQALSLYNDLYLKKYSTYNPQFTLRYFEHCYKENMILFQGYKDENNQLKAFSGLFILDQTITSPLVGYDTKAPQKEGLYIHAAQLAILHKFKSGLLANLSSGASGFKRFRGGVASIEYSAIYIKHLPRKRRVIWKLLAIISNKIGVPIIRKYKL